MDLQTNMDLKDFFAIRGIVYFNHGITLVDPIHRTLLCTSLYRGSGSIFFFFRMELSVIQNIQIQTD